MSLVRPSETLPELRPTDRCECGLVVGYGEAFHRSSPAHKLRVLAQALRAIRDTSAGYASNVARRALDEAGIEDPPEEDGC